MAASKSSPNAPGSSVSGGVRGTLNAPFDKPGKGSQGNMRAPFDKPRSGGDNGLPTKIYDSTPGANGTPKPSGVSSIGTIAAAGSRKK
jgi:hypothetical protein